MDKIYEIKTTEQDCGTRIDAVICSHLPEYTRSFIQKLLKNGQVTIQDKTPKSNYKCKQNDIIKVTVPPPVEVDIKPEKMDLPIIYEDDDILIINKPKGMVVHPSAGHWSQTLVNGLMYHCKDQLSGINGELRPGIVHRIDMDTTGLLVVCKNDAAHNFLAAQLKEHSITRKYIALVKDNIISDTGTVDAPIGRHKLERKKMAINYQNGKHAVTHYKVLERFGKYTLIECQLETGRTHQIRVHMASIHHPLIGDTVYGSEKQPFALQGQCLHAKVLGFIHPTTREYIEFSAPLPNYFELLLEKIRKTT